MGKNDGTLLTTLTAHQDEVEGIAFSQDGEILASASADSIAVARAVRTSTLVSHPL
ncbi:WD40 repeat domain-containing protein [Moorena producens]|uniref:WD40 repeat domain-containing protein n=1 Tax=Moorena producens TaxID=1155739 RepID=UPI0002DFF9DB|nr:WD40 repeat domain-containing protein [Moorena producens]